MEKRRLDHHLTDAVQAAVTDRPRDLRDDIAISVLPTVLELMVGDQYRTASLSDTDLRRRAIVRSYDLAREVMDYRRSLVD